ncbi:MAG: hypothetical protein WC205_11985 [Opitutaceae bacterium]
MQIRFMGDSGLIFYSCDGWTTCFAAIRSYFVHKIRLDLLCKVNAADCMRHPVTLLLILAAALTRLIGSDAQPSSCRELLLPRVEIPSTDNALFRWRPAFADLFPDDPEIAHQLDELSSPLMNAQVGDHALQTWLAPLTARLAELTVHNGESFQQPPINGPETPFPDHQPLRQLAVLRTAMMKMAWRDGRHDAALALAEENLNLARTLLVSQEGLIPLLNATGIWQLALDDVYWLARRPNLTPAQAARLQTALLRDETLASDALSRAFCGELTFFTQVVIERLPRTHDVEQLLSSIGSLGMAPPEPIEPGSLSLAPAVNEPFDREATLLAAANDVRAWVNAFSSASRHPRTLQRTHTQAHLTTYVREIPALLQYATEEVPTTQEQVTSVDTEIAAVENPVGKLFLIITTPNWNALSVSLFRRAAQRNALLGLLAWRRLGRPASWKDLVVAGLLAKPPADPFSQGSLHYDPNPKNARIWSVGINGVDDGGLGDGENIGLPPDFTWPAR